MADVAVSGVYSCQDTALEALCQALHCVAKMVCN